MTNPSTISNLSPAGTLTGSEYVPIVQNGVTVRTTAASLVATTGINSIIAGTGISVSGAIGNVTVSLATPVSVANGGTGASSLAGAGIVTTSQTNVVTNAMLSNVATATFKGRTTAGTGSPEDLTATQATALLNTVVGDSGSGGTKGLVPAPVAGDSARVLRGDGTFGSAITLGTPQASTSGTSIDFTSIPTGVKRVSVNFVGVSTNGTSAVLIQIGDSGGVETTGYLGACAQLDNGSLAVTNYTAGFGINNPSSGAASVRHGTITLTLENSSNATWVASGSIAQSNSANFQTTAGSKSLSPGPIDRVRVTTVNGTDAFDAGEINISYE